MLRLADLKASSAGASRSLRRELLRWRELMGSLYLQPEQQRHRGLFRALLLLTPETYRQIPFVLGRG